MLERFIFENEPTPTKDPERKTGVSAIDHEKVDLRKKIEFFKYGIHERVPHISYYPRALDEYLEGLLSTPEGEENAKKILESLSQSKEAQDMIRHDPSIMVSLFSHIAQATIGKPEDIRNIVLDAKRKYEEAVLDGIMKRRTTDSPERAKAVRSMLKEKFDYIQQLKHRLDEITEISYEDPNFASWLHDVTMRPDGPEEVENFFSNLKANEKLRITVRENPEMFEDLFYVMSQRSLGENEDAGEIIHNVRERHNEKARNKKDLTERLLSNPEATPEEYDLGVYRENIESQVREAIFVFQKKGYCPMESGFNDLERGTQMVGLATDPGMHADLLMESLNKKFEGVSQIALNVIRNRVQIIVIPENKTLPLEKWKTIWNEIATRVPTIKRTNPVIQNGLQGIEFREIQEKIRRNENTWLSEDLAFVDGKVTRMAKEVFLRLEELRSTL